MRSYQMPGDTGSLPTVSIFTAAAAILSLVFGAVMVAGQAPGLRLLPGDRTVTAAAGDQAAPSIAYGSDMVLAVWSDDRANVLSGYDGETSRDIYGVRFDSDGVQLDAVAIPITAARATQDAPKVVWNGSNWLVVFETHLEYADTDTYGAPAAAKSAVRS